MYQSAKSEETVKYCHLQIERIKMNRATLQDERNLSLAYFYGNEDFDVELVPKKNFSSVVSKDVFSKISALMPMLLKPFVNNDDVLQVLPRTPEDVPGAKDLTALINYYFITLNPWNSILYDTFLDACLMKNGYIGYEWKKHEKKIIREFDGLTYEELLELLSDDKYELIHKESRVPEEMGLEPPDRYQPEIDEFGQPIVKGKGPSEDLLIYDVEVYEVLESYYYPCLEAIKPEDVGHAINEGNLKDCGFAWRDVYLEEWEIRKEYGDSKFEAIQNIYKAYEQDYLSHEDLTYARVYDMGGGSFLYDDEADKWKIRRCYYRDQKKGTPMVAEICGHLLLKEEENNYRRPNFVPITTYRVAHRIIGLSQFEIIKPYQKLNTVLKREIMNHIYYGNRGRYGYDPNKVNVKEFMMGNRPGGIFKQSGSDGLFYHPTEPLPPFLPQLISMWEQQEEVDTGITKYNQGTDSKSLNKTARGMQSIMNMSMQRVELMLTIISESLNELVKEVVDLIMENLEEPVAIRVLGKKWEKLNLDNIAGSYDIVIKAGVGVTEKDYLIQQLQQLIGLAQGMQGMGIFTADNAYALLKELIINMGFKNWADFVSDPKLKELIIQLIQMVIQVSMQVIGQVPPEALQMIQQIIPLIGADEQEQMNIGSMMKQTGAGGGNPSGPFASMQSLAPLSGQGSPGG